MEIKKRVKINKKNPIETALDNGEIIWQWKGLTFYVPKTQAAFHQYRPFGVICLKNYLLLRCV